MKRKSGKHYHHGELRDALIRAAEKIIDEEGIEAVTMRRLSEQAGVSHAAPYRHFSDKAELLAATAAEGFRRFGRALNMARTTEGIDSLARFRNMGDAYIRFAVENTACYRLMFGRGTMPETPELREAGDLAFGELLAAIQELQEAGIVQDDDPRMQATFIWSMMHGLALLLIDGKLDHSISDLPSAMDFFGQHVLLAFRKG